MNDYYSVRIDVSPCTPDITALAAAFMADAGFESFEPDVTGLTAYIRAEGTDPDSVARQALAGFPIPVTFDIKSTLVEGEDWNAEWEKHYFRPIEIDDACVVHSSFHKDVPSARLDIVIDPKMAFGTGHHDTTSQMMRYILQEDIAGKSVIDMGTGTGILAILASMRGASAVAAVEIDRPAYENALENAVINKTEINIIHGDASALEGLEPADYLFANINRNIILEDMDRYTAALRPGGTMLLSGFYREDIPVVGKRAAESGLTICDSKESNRWVAVRLLKNY